MPRGEECCPPKAPANRGSRCVMSDVWKRWEGQVVDHKYQLQQFLGSTDHSVVFLAEFHDPRPDAAPDRGTPPGTPRCDPCCPGIAAVGICDRRLGLPIFSRRHCSCCTSRINLRAMWDQNTLRRAYFHPLHIPGVSRLVVPGGTSGAGGWALVVFILPRIAQEKSILMLIV